MSIHVYAQIAAGLALVFAVLVFSKRMRDYRILPQPVELAKPKGSLRAGVVYAFTLGMAPWSKESTRLHTAAYLRGVAFHIGIFIGLGILLASPWIVAVPSTWKIFLAVGSGVGAILGAAGLAARLFEPNLKSLSTPDDYLAVLLVSLFLAGGAIWLVLPAAGPVYFLLAVVMLVYAPFSKIRHCLFYAASRISFGRFAGSRAILPHSQQTRLKRNR